MLLNSSWTVAKIDWEINQRARKIDELRAEVDQLQDYKERKIGGNRGHFFQNGFEYTL